MRICNPLARIAVFWHGELIVTPFEVIGLHMTLRRGCRSNAPLGFIRIVGRCFRQDEEFLRSRDGVDYCRHDVKHDAAEPFMPPTDTLG
jgi:hypothetical protein